MIKRKEMENNANIDMPTTAGTIGGTFLVLLLQISGEEMARTAMLAAVGAVVSFCVSFLLRLFVRRSRKE
jgi:hypothetical protein